MLVVDILLMAGEEVGCWFHHEEATPPDPHLQEMLSIKSKFCQMNKVKSDDFTSFLTGLHQLAIMCNFTDNGHKVKSRIIQGCLSNRLCRKALSELSIAFVTLKFLPVHPDVPDGLLVQKQKPAERPILV